MTLDTARFGTITYEDGDILNLPEGLLGFPDKRQFLVLTHREGSSFRWLQSVDDPALAFLVLDPAEFNASYAPEISDEAARELELEAETARIVYAIVSIPHGKAEDMTANLAGPIVINAERRIAKQIVVEDPKWTTRHHILDEMSRAGQAPADEKNAA